MSEHQIQQESTVLIVDDVMDNLALLHDALDESGYRVLVANDGQTALETAQNMQPDIILLDAIMPEMDGFQVCVKLKANMVTNQIPVIFMTGLTESEHVVKAFQSGGTDYITKPIRINEVLARVTSHMQTSMMVKQARVALDAFGQAAIALSIDAEKIVWQTPLAKKLLKKYFEDTYSEYLSKSPVPILNWVNNLSLNKQNLENYLPLVIIKARSRLTFTVTETSNDEQIVILLREESDEAQIEALMNIFKLTMRESEVLYWATKGKTSRDIGDILGSSPRTVNKHLEHVFVKLGVETRTAAASIAASKLRIMNF
jgi:DNA-binding response OmpR family regulator/DNA-binding CsgD family transcriptional regulator